MARNILIVPRAFIVAKNPDGKTGHYEVDPHEALTMTEYTEANEDGSFGCFVDWNSSPVKFYAGDWRRGMETNAKIYLTYPV